MLKYRIKIIKIQKVWRKFRLRLYAQRELLMLQFQVMEEFIYRLYRQIHGSRIYNEIRRKIQLEQTNNYYTPLVTLENAVLFIIGVAAPPAMLLKSSLCVFKR